MNDIAAINPHALMEEVIAKGDLAKLTQAQRNAYYLQVCESIGLNPLTQPFSYITLNGRLTLYAAKGATDQLRTTRGVSVEDMSESEKDGVFIVTVKVKDRDGRTDMAKGAVPIMGLKGEALANAIMKAETKAKRRATLSLCGLGMLDESEIETIPASALGAPKAVPATPVAKPLPSPPPAPPQAVYDPETGEVGPHPIPVPMAPNGKPDWIRWGGDLVTQLQRADSLAEGEEWIAQCEAALKECATQFPKVRERIEANIRVMRERFEPPADFMSADDPLRPL